MSDSSKKTSHSPRPEWYSRMGFILAAVGSAVGLGNIWRFSYLCYKNGGGAFLIPYALALLVVGIPLMILELGIGHKMRGSAPMSLAKVNPNWEWCGWWAVILAMFGIMLYYSAVISWCLSYMFYSFDLSWGSNPEQFFFKEYLQVSSGPFELGDIRSPIMFSLIGVWALSWLIVFFGVQKGVERANKIFMPFLCGLVLILVVWSLTLPGAWGGLKVYLTPDFSRLRHPQIWIDAFSQIFFTLSLGFGIMIAYASYLPKKADVAKDGLIICAANCAFSFIAGFAVFGTLGYMSHVTGTPLEEVVRESIGLAFVAYPQAISLLPAFAEVFGVVFFGSLVIAGLSSAISLVEAFTSAVIDKFQYPRPAVVSFLCFLGFLGSIIFTAKSGLYWVDIVDHFVTHYGLVILGIIECALIGWVYGAKRLREHISYAAGKMLPPAWDVCVRYATPIVLLLLLINDLKLELSSPYEEYSWIAVILIGRDGVLLTLVASLIIAMRPWKQPLDGSKDK